MQSTRLIRYFVLNSSAEDIGYGLSGRATPIPLQCAATTLKLNLAMKNCSERLAKQLTVVEKNLIKLLL